MNQTTLTAMNSIKLTHPKTGEEKILQASGFDVLGFFFPFLRLLIGGRILLAIAFIPTVMLYPIWSWYIGFNFNRMQVTNHLKKGWQPASDVVVDKKTAAIAA